MFEKDPPIITDCLKTGPRVRIVIPDDQVWKGKYDTHGLHFKFHKQTGHLVCGAGKGFSYVHFDQQKDTQYIACPNEYLERL